MVNNVIAIDRRVQYRVFFQRSNSGFNEKAHETQFHTVFFFKAVFVFRTQVHHGLHIDFVKRGQNRIGGL